MFDGPFSISALLGLKEGKDKDSDKRTRNYKLNSYSSYSTPAVPTNIVRPEKKKVVTTTSSLKQSQQDEKKAKRFRSSFSTEQLRTMEDTFRHRPYLSTTQVEELAGTLNLSNRQVKIWFQNRRTKLKKQVTPLSFGQVKTYHNPTISQYLYYIQNNNDNIMNTLSRYNDRR